ncbi:MAG: trypsin-like serine protease [Bacteroidota bacterium]
MKALARFFILIIFTCIFQGLIVRHDIADEKFIELAKNYPQVCHLPMGEATLVDSLWAITAGHIGQDLMNDISKGYVPTLTCNGTKYSIEKVLVHPGFKSMEEGLQNDIALVKIKEAVKDVRPAKIYEKADELGKIITIVGMGDKGTGLTGPLKWDKITRAATNKIEEVGKQWVNFGFDSPESANGTAMEGVSGPGDSGGPAFIDSEGVRYIVGVSSHQTGQGKYGKGHYGVTEYYSRISSYKDWITETLATNKK